MSLRVPVATLRIFDAAARHQSFKAAALELSLTPSAVSHAVKRMEDALGVPLFERSGRNLLLTPSGEALKAHTDRAFEELRVGLEMVSARRPQILRLHCAPSFAANWLTPRLSRFIAQHPEVELRLSAGVDYARFDTDEFDADIIYGPPRQKGLEVMPLCEEIVTPLCSPAMAERIKAVGDLLQQPLIQSEFKQVRWPEWFELNGMPRPSLPQGSRFDRSFLALTAAANGLGVALESTLLAEAEIASGKLVQPLEGSTRPIAYIGHHLVHPHAFRTRAPLRLFKEWIRKEMLL